MLGLQVCALGRLVEREFSSPPRLAAKQNRTAYVAFLLCQRTEEAYSWMGLRKIGVYDASPEKPQRVRVLPRPMALYVRVVAFISGSCNASSFFFCFFLARLKQVRTGLLCFSVARDSFVSFIREPTLGLFSVERTLPSLGKRFKTSSR